MDSDHDGSFRCECSSTSFRFRDGSCRLKSACDTHNDCHKDAICTTLFDTLACKCKENFYDASPDPETRPGNILMLVIVFKCQVESVNLSRTNVLRTFITAGKPRFCQTWKPLHLSPNAKCEDRADG